MADLNISKTDNATAHEDVGQNYVLNSDFELAPPFTAATNTNNRWIDGTAAGSTTNDIYKYATLTMTGTDAAQFDSAQAHGGSNSMKLSTLATASRIVVGVVPNVSSVANILKYGWPVLPSTSYKITYWMKTTANSGDSNNGANMLVHEYASDGTSGVSTNGTAVKTTTGWTQYTINRTTASTAAYMTLELQVIGNTGVSTLILDAWFDDIVVQPVARLTGVDLPLGPVVGPGIQEVSGPKIWG